MPTFREMAGREEARLFVGRETELSLFQVWLDARVEIPQLLNISGPGGVGKTTLLRAFARCAAERGRTVVTIDGGGIRPTPESLLGALGSGDRDAAVTRLNAERPLLLIDTFEQLGGLTRYLQEEFLPYLDTDVRVVLAGRYPLGVAWRAESGWPLPIRSVPLAGLERDEARTYLRSPRH